MKLPAAILALILAAASPALADSISVAGTISSVDPNTHQIVLDNGKAYSVAPSVDLSAMKTGDKVVLTAQTQDGVAVVDSIAPQQP